MIGEDPRDSTSVSWDEGSLAAALKTPRKKWRVGLPKEFREVVQSPILQKTWKETERCVEAFGGEIVEVSLPNVRYALPTYYIIALSEASSNLARYDGVRYGHRSGAASDIIELYEKSRGEGFGRETRKRVLLGTYCLSAGYLDEYYNRARRVRTLIAEDFRRAFEKVDVLAWPTAPTPAFPFGSHADDPLTMYLEDVFTVPVNLAWLPAISVPVTLSQEGLPMGLTIAGPAMGDQTVIRAAADFEQARDLSR
jgi:aspartyl-tRNA(Asn)/glutamyl-tRNA(Gln) amidotransferase subunit A